MRHIMAAAPSPLRRIVVCYTVNQFGTWFGYMALIVAVYDQTHSVVTTALLLLAAQVLPAFITPAVVARAETSGHPRTLSAFYLVEVAATLALVFLLGHFWLPAILVVAAVDGIAALAASALLRAAATQIGSDTQIARGASEHVSAADAAEFGLRKANAALNAAYTPAIVLGPALAGLVVASAGGRVALLLDALSFLFCAISLRRLGTNTGVAKRPIMELLTEIAEHLRDVRPLRVLLFAEGLALIFFASIEPVEVAYAKTTLHAGDRGYGLLLGAWGIGMVIGSVLFGRWMRRPLGPLVTVGGFAVGISYMGMAVSPSLLAASCISVVGGVGNGVQWVSFTSLAQQLTPRHLHTRLISALQSMATICPVGGLAMGGAITAASSPRIALWVAGGGAIGAAALLLRVAFPRVASLDPQNVPANG